MSVLFPVLIWLIISFPTSLARWTSRFFSWQSRRIRQVQFVLSTGTGQLNASPGLSEPIIPWSGVGGADFHPAISLCSTDFIWKACDRAVPLVRKKTTARPVGVLLNARKDTDKSVGGLTTGVRFRPHRAMIKSSRSVAIKPAITR